MNGFLELVTGTDPISGKISETINLVFFNSNLGLNKYQFKKREKRFKNSQKPPESKLLSFSERLDKHIEYKSNKEKNNIQMTKPSIKRIKMSKMKIQKKTLMYLIEFSRILIMKLISILAKLVRNLLSQRITISSAIIVFFWVICRFKL